MGLTRFLLLAWLLLAGMAWGQEPCVKLPDGMCVVCRGESGITKCQKAECKPEAIPDEATVLDNEVKCPERDAKGGCVFTWESKTDRVDWVAAVTPASELPARELMDVPALSWVEQVEDYPLKLQNCKPSKIVGGTSSLDVCDTAKHPQKYWTCADKSRILLTSEDGKRHCLKFPNE